MSLILHTGKGGALSSPERGIHKRIWRPHVFFFSSPQRSTTLQRAVPQSPFVRSFVRSIRSFIRSFRVRSHSFICNSLNFTLLIKLINPTTYIMARGDPRWKFWWTLGTFSAQMCMQIVIIGLTAARLSSMSVPVPSFEILRHFFAVTCCYCAYKQTCNLTPQETGLCGSYFSRSRSGARVIGHLTFQPAGIVPPPQGWVHEETSGDTAVGLVSNYHSPTARRKLL